MTNPRFSWGSSFINDWQHWDLFLHLYWRHNNNYDETEEETEETPNHGEGFPPGEPKSGEDGGNRSVWPTGFIPESHPQVQEGLRPQSTEKAGIW